MSDYVTDEMVETAARALHDFTDEETIYPPDRITRRNHE